MQHTEPGPSYRRFVFAIESRRGLDIVGATFHAKPAEEMNAPPLGRGIKLKWHQVAATAAILRAQDCRITSELSLAVQGPSVFQ